MSIFGGSVSTTLLLAAWVFLVSAMGCAPKPNTGSIGSGGTASGGSASGGSASGGSGSGGSASGGAGSGGAGSGGSGVATGGSGSPVSGSGGASSATSGTCAENPQPLRTTGSAVAFTFELTFAGRPLVFGEPNALAAGGTLTPQDVRFYLSQAALVRVDGTSVPVDIVNSAGVPEPYGVHFFTADDPSSGTMTVLAPPDNYKGLSFLWGLTLACNQGDSTQLHVPLSDTSQMTWPHAFGGYLFFKYGALVMGTPSDAGTTAEPPSLIHMGGSVTMDAAPMITVQGMFAVSAGVSTSKTILVGMDEIFRGAAMDVDLSDFPLPPGGDEVALGERLRRTTPGLNIFTFAP
jgi:hypothetical protein